MPSDANTEEIHRQLLILLKKFHEICMENGINYSLHGGTLLGAVREKGFIPWDDDADVTLMRSEYEKFCRVMRQKDYGDNIFFQDHTSFYLPRLFLKEAEKQLVWIDFFTYDYISGNPICQKLKLVGVMFFDGLTKPKDTWSITRTKTYLAKWQLAIYYFIYLLGRLFPQKWCTSLKECFRKNCFCGRRNLVHRSNDQYIGMITVLPASVMENYEIIPFEDTELMISKQFHKILMSSYGENYMIPMRFGSEQDKMHRLTRNIYSG